MSILSASLFCRTAELTNRTNRHAQLLVHTQRIFHSRFGKIYQPRPTKTNQEYHALFPILPFPADNITLGARAKYPGRPILLWPGDKPVPRRQRDQILAGASSGISSSHMQWTLELTTIFHNNQRNVPTNAHVAHLNLGCLY